MDANENLYAAQEGNMEKPTAVIPRYFGHISNSCVVQGT